MSPVHVAGVVPGGRGGVGDELGALRAVNALGLPTDQDKDRPYVTTCMITIMFTKKSYLIVGMSTFWLFKFKFNILIYG